jgi:hypothetical protein
MDNIFFESATPFGHGLYFAPGWTGHERVYALPRPENEPGFERQAFAVDGRRVLRTALSRSGGNRNPQSAADGNWQGQPMPQQPSMPQPQQQPTTPRIGPLA